METTTSLPDPLCYQGQLFPQRVEEVLRARLADEKIGLRSLLVRYRRELEADSPDFPEREGGKASASAFSTRAHHWRPRTVSNW